MRELNCCMRTTILYTSSTLKCYLRVPLLVVGTDFGPWRCHDALAARYFRRSPTPTSRLCLRSHQFRLRRSLEIRGRGPARQLDSYYIVCIIQLSTLHASSSASTNTTHLMRAPQGSESRFDVSISVDPISHRALRLSELDPNKYV